MEDEAFAVSVNGFSLNLPANVSAFTPGLREDLGRQIDSMAASMTSLAQRCVTRSEDVLPYFGRLCFYRVSAVMILTRLHRHGVRCERHRLPFPTH